jgi:tetratricopeptide (TPR) repeat protein
MDLRLIDLGDGTVIDAEHATGDDVYELVDELSRRLSPHLLAGGVEPTELTPVAQLATGSLDAFRKYREGVLAERRFLYERAEAHYRRAVGMDSTFAVAWLRLGLNLFRQQNVAEATSAMGQAERFIEGTSERDRLMIEAILSFISFESETAERSFEELIAKYPDDKEARSWLAVLYSQTDRRDDHRRALEEILRLDPFYAPAYNELAYMAARAADSTAADSLSLRYLDLEPGQPNPWDSRGEILEMLGRPDEGREAFREAVAIEESFVHGYQHLVRSYLRAGDMAGARAELVTHLGTDDPDAAVWVRLLSADTYVAEGSYLDGLDGYRQAAARASELDRDDLRLLALLDAGKLASAVGDFDGAQAFFQAARMIDSYNQEAFFGSLVALGQQGQVDRMRAIRQAVVGNLDQVPENFRAFANQGLRFTDGLIAYYEGNLERSVKLMEQARANFSLQYVFREEIEALIELGRADEALATIGRMAGVTPIRTGDRELPLNEQAKIYERGRAYEAMGDAGRAIQQYDRLYRMAGEGLRQIAFMWDTRERLERLKASVGDPSLPSAADSAAGAGPP